ncbi:hypothetical protein C8R46DRAFT_1349405 [Mycena filopes]|nr:hypothetical protein C8R46DRAFT_1349405 [Mycena filopes]
MAGRHHQTHYRPGVATQYNTRAGSSRRPLAPRPPPHIPSPDITGNIGTPLHVSALQSRACVDCTAWRPRDRRVYIPGLARPVTAPAINVLTSARPRHPDPRELKHFDFTLQMSTLNAPERCLRLLNKVGVLANFGELVNGSVRIEKAGGYNPYANSAMMMTRVNLQGPGYAVEWVLQTADQFDVGMWGWYRYPNGSYRVYTWKTHDRTPPQLVAWRSPEDWHWHLHEMISAGGSHTMAAKIMIICGIVCVEAMGGTLARRT